MLPVQLGLSALKADSVDEANRVLSLNKTAWDWLDLLIVPAILAGGAALLSQAQKSRDLEEKEIDRQIAKDRQEQSSLENYYDRIGELLLWGLRNTDDDDEARTIARARTLSVLRTLNEPRKGQVVRFLYESDLINRPNPVIILISADLTGADLKFAYLAEAYLRGVKLERGLTWLGLTFPDLT